MANGSYSHNFVPGKLRSMIQEGKDAQEIMEELGIAKYTLQEQILMLERRDNTFYNVPGLVSEPEEEKIKRLMKRKEGIVFSKDMLEKSGFHPGDAFEMLVEEDRITLKKIDPKK